MYLLYNHYLSNYAEKCPRSEHLQWDTDQELKT